MKNLIALLPLLTATMLAWETETQDGHAHTQVEASRGFKSWKVPTVGMEGLASHSYSRVSGYAQFGGHLRLTGAITNSEGLPFGQVLTGWVFAPKNSEHTELYIEPQLGTAITEAKARLALGFRALYSSPNWFVESWIMEYPGREQDSWTNCEPLLDVTRRVYKGLYVGAVSSCYAGKLHHDAEELSHAKRVLHLFGGPGLVVRKGSLDLGISYEIPFYGRNQGAKNYVAIFGSFKF